MPFEPNARGNTSFGAARIAGAPPHARDRPGELAP